MCQTKPHNAPALPSGFSEYIVFVDESGSPTLKDIDPDFPLLVLAFLIVKKTDYSASLCPALQNFKFRHFGHDQVILHERDIRRDSGSFSFLRPKERKSAFLDELTCIIAEQPFHLVAVVIQKDVLKQRYVSPENPYHLALKYGLERIAGFLEQMEGTASSPEPILHVIVECRGKSEDNSLELEFRRICDGENYTGKNLPFSLIFTDKKANTVGLQLADLIARPVGMSVLRPNQSNRAFDVLKTKLVERRGLVNGWGLKVFP